MKPYRVSGSFRMGDRMSPFTQETVADDADGARERVLSTLGSRHRVDRHHVELKDVVEMKPADVQDPSVKKRLSMVK
jgi:large subunit ribosomal protein LX